MFFGYKLEIILRQRLIIWGGSFSYSTDVSPYLIANFTKEGKSLMPSFCMR